MARQIATIQNTIITQVQATPELAQANSTSNRAIWRLWTFIVATAVNILEQLMDTFTGTMNTLAAQAVPGTPAWVQAQVFKFQYSTVTPYQVQLLNLIPTYSVIDPTSQIITRCSVKTDLAGNVNIKVAKQNPPIALITAELNALQSYMNTVGYAGINYNVISLNPDQIMIAANIYYKGQYNAVIAGNVTTAITAFLASLPFDGSLRISDLEIAIKNVVGVNDVVLTGVRVRRDVDVFAAGTDLVLGSQTISRLYSSVAGYLVAETTSGQTLTNTLNFISE